MRGWVIPFAAIMMVVGLAASAVDVWYYTDFVRSQGLSVWSVVPLPVVWSYLTTMPGALLTSKSIVSWILAYGCFTIAAHA